MIGLLSPLYPSAETLKAFCLQPGVDAWSIEETFQPKRVSRSLHEPLACLTPEIKLSGRQWLIQVTAASNVSLQSGLLRLGRRYLYESNPHNASKQEHILRVGSGFPPGSWHRTRDPKSYPQPLLLLSTHNNPNYFHWLTQPGLAPLFLQEHFGLESLPGLKLALSHRPRHSLPSYVSSLLDVFAPELPQVHGIAIASQTSCRFALQEHRTNVVVSPAQLHWLKRRCRDRIQLDRKPWRRVLISRKRSNHRRCLNEDQLFAALACHGFERYCLEDLSAIDQLRLFAESVLLVGAHGAGFSNLIACSPHATVVELMHKPGDFSHYYAISEILGLQHAHLLAYTHDRRNDDFKVSLDDLIRLMEEIGCLD